MLIALVGLSSVYLDIQQRWGVNGVWSFGKAQSNSRPINQPHEYDIYRAVYPRPGKESEKYTEIGIPKPVSLSFTPALVIGLNFKVAKFLRTTKACSVSLAYPRTNDYKPHPFVLLLGCRQWNCKF